MLERIGGVGGLLGLVVVLGGLALIGSHSLRVAGGIALVVVGLGLVVRGIVQGVLVAMGMDGML